MKYCLSLFFFLLFAGNQLLSAQDKTKIEVEGYVELEEDENFGNVKITISEDGVVKETHYTDADGSFAFKLELNKIYTIEASKLNRCTKRIEFNSNVPADSKWKLGSGFSFFLFTSCPGMDMSLLEKPIVKIKYNPKTTYFEEDKAYVEEMAPKLKDLNDRLEKCRYQKVQDVIDKADESFKKEDYANATKLYKEVINLDPENKYAPKQLAEIEKIKKKQGSNDKKYQELIQKADLAFTNKQNANARDLYNQAILVKPNDTYSRNRIAEIDKIEQKIASDNNAKKAEAERYANLVTQAKQAEDQNNATEAIRLYKEALAVRPNESVPQQRITALEQKLAKENQDTQTKKQKQAEFDRLFAEGERYFAENKFDQATVAYNSANGIFPDPRIKTRLYEMDAKRNEQARQMKQMITDNLDNAKKSYKEMNYELARQYYSKALELEKTNKEAINGIALCDSQLGEKKARELKEAALKRDYQNSIMQADNAYKQKQYELALTNYRNALQLQPNEIYPDTKIKEIEKIISEQQAADAQSKARKEQYNKYIAKADKFFTGNKLEDAETSYRAALELFPQESYPTEQINKINATRKQRDTESAYNKAIAEADDAFNQNNMTQARTLYQLALEKKANDIYVTGQIKKIDSLEANAREKLALEQANKLKYNKFMADADKAFTTQSYDIAKQNYQSALTLYPNEQRPKDRIAEIEKMKLANETALKEKNEREAKEREQKYAALIADGDKKFIAKDYENAVSQYNAALAVKPGQTYPLSKLKEIEQLNAANKLNNDYKQALLKADNLFKTNDLEGAKAQYILALQIKPNEIYPQNQITEITRLIEKQKSDKLAKEKNKTQYDACIVRADKFFNGAKYDDARIEYEKARDLMPEETYPRQKLAKIREMKELLAQNSKKEVQPVKEEKKALADLKFTNDKERDAYLKNLREKYPVGITKEVYKDDRRTITRYIIIRGDDVNDYREVRYNWGGVEYFKTDKPANAMYFNQQISTRSGEKLYE